MTVTVGSKPNMGYGVHPDTQVATLRGMISIQTVVVGDCVLTTGGFFPVSRIVASAYRLPVVKASLTDGKSLICTPDSPFLALRRHTADNQVIMPDVVDHLAGCKVAPYVVNPDVAFGAVLTPASIPDADYGDSYAEADVESLQGFNREHQSVTRDPLSTFSYVGLNDMTTNDLAVSYNGGVPLAVSDSDSTFKPLLDDFVLASIMSVESMSGMEESYVFSIEVSTGHYIANGIVIGVSDPF